MLHVTIHGEPGWHVSMLAPWGACRVGKDRPPLVSPLGKTLGSAAAHLRQEDSAGWERTGRWDALASGRRAVGLSSAHLRQGEPAGWERIGHPLSVPWVTNGQALL